LLKATLMVETAVAPVLLYVPSLVTVPAVPLVWPITKPLNGA
jgi:hypothetical protein